MYRNRKPTSSERGGKHIVKIAIYRNELKIERDGMVNKRDEHNLEKK